MWLSLTAATLGLGTTFSGASPDWTSRTHQAEQLFPAAGTGQSGSDSRDNGQDAVAPAQDPDESAGATDGSVKENRTPTIVETPDRAVSLQPLLLARTERTGLMLLAACGSIAIAWSCLKLDHLTRHHFSRRVQTIAALAWALFVAAILWLLSGLAT